MKKIFITLSGAAVMLLLPSMFSSCRENEYGTVDLDLTTETEEEEGESYTEISASYVYNHPCAMYNQDDFDRVKAMLDDGTAPEAVQEEFANLKNSKYTLLTYTASPQTSIIRGGTTSGVSQNYTYAMRDAAAAYQMALLWKLTETETYASIAVDILNQWAATCTEITSTDNDYVLAAGAQGCTFANAAEILRDYDGWSESDFSTFCSWMKNLFGPVNLDFMTNHGGNCEIHYWSNWDLVNMCSYLSIGILTEDDDMVNYVVNYFYDGVGNGCINKFIVDKHDDPLSTGETICQAQESGRDQGHCTMSIAVVAQLCQMAYTLYKDNTSVPELDFFAADDNAVLGMAEYIGLTNYRDGDDNDNSTGSYLIAIEKIPFTEYDYCYNCSCSNWSSHYAIHTEVSDSDRGSIRPAWEILMNHYVNVKGLSSGYIYTNLFAEKLRPEGGAGEPDLRYGDNSGAFDQLGWNTLMLYQE